VLCFDGRIIFIADEDMSGMPFSCKGKYSKQEYGDSPKPDGIDIRTDLCKIFPDKGHLSDHPRENPVCITPDPADIWLGLLHIPVRVDSGKPMSAGLIDIDRMDLLTEFFHRAICQQAVFASTAENDHTIFQ